MCESDSLRERLTRTARRRDDKKNKRWARWDKNQYVSRHPNVLIKLKFSSMAQTPSSEIKRSRWIMSCYNQMEAIAPKLFILKNKSTPKILSYSTNYKKFSKWSCFRQTSLYGQALDRMNFFGQFLAAEGAHAYFGDCIPHIPSSLFPEQDRGRTSENQAGNYN